MCLQNRSTTHRKSVLCKSSRLKLKQVFLNSREEASCRSDGSKRRGDCRGDVGQTELVPSQMDTRFRRCRCQCCSSDLLTFQECPRAAVWNPDGEIKSNYARYHCLQKWSVFSSNPPTSLFLAKRGVDALTPGEPTKN